VRPSREPAAKLAVRDLPLSSLRPNPRNARTHRKRQIQQIADSISAFGFLNPILVDDAGMVLAGHGRLKAAQKLGLQSVPTISAVGLTEAQKRAYVLADNKLAEKAGWDRSLLVAELGELAVLLPPLELDLTITGFDPSRDRRPVRGPWANQGRSRRSGAPGHRRPIHPAW
jgi:ParB-like chromosome segregation protein Spo0J